MASAAMASFEDRDLEDESTPLVRSSSETIPGQLRRRALALGGGSVLLFGVALMGRASVEYVPKTNAVFEEEAMQSAPVRFELAGKYGSDVPGDGMYPWKFIAEPHKEITFTALDSLTKGEALAAAAAPGAEVKYHWHIVEDDLQAVGDSLKHTFTRTGSHEVRLSRFEGETQTHFSTETVAVRYVKRELRSLDDVDREAFFAALETVRCACCCAVMMTFFGGGGTSVCVINLKKTSAWHPAPRPLADIASRSAPPLAGVQGEHGRGQGPVRRQLRGHRDAGVAAPRRGGAQGLRPLARRRGDYDAPPRVHAPHGARPPGGGRQRDHPLLGVDRGRGRAGQRVA